MLPFANLQGYDIAVIGAGPAGAAAAVAAAELRLRVAIVDEHAVAGGQAYRVVPGIAPRHADAERTDGDKVRAQLGAANVVRYFGHRVAHIEHAHDRWHVHAAGPNGATTIEARALVVATGAQERHLPFAGWETPGVMGLAAATLLLKAERVLPGRNVVVAGAGPLLLLVAKAIIDGGGRVAGIVDAHPRSAWFASATELLSRPDLATRGMNWYRAVVGHGVAMHHGNVIVEVTGAAPDLRVRAVAVDRDGLVQPGAAPVDIACDAVCCGFGLVSSTDFTHMLGASHGFDPALGGWHVVDRRRAADVGAAALRGRRRRGYRRRGGGAVAGPHRRHRRGERPGQAERGGACGADGAGQARGAACRAIRRRDDATRERRRRRRRFAGRGRDGVPMPAPDARNARPGDRRGLRDVRRTEGGDRLRHRRVRRTRLRGSRRAPHLRCDGTHARCRRASERAAAAAFARRLTLCASPADERLARNQPHDARCCVALWVADALAAPKAAT